MSALIYSQKIQKSFGAKRLFHGITFGISESDRVGIIGPNGSGKSTFLKILAGLEAPDEGTVTRRQHLRVAYVPQDTQFLSDMTVGEILHESALQSGLPQGEGEILVYEVLGKVGFSDGSQRVDVLSGGWKKRLAIACAMM
jgi:ATP-binding cassette subfamily F protein uup